MFSLIFGILVSCFSKRIVLNHTNVDLVLVTCPRAQVLSERVDGLTGQIDDLEMKAQSLQMTIDRLNVALAQSTREESSHKDKVSTLLSLN